MEPVAKMTTKPRRKKKAKPLAEMNTADLEEATAEFDQELIIDSSSPLTTQQRAKWNKAKKKRGRPKVGRGVPVISVSIEKGLLHKTDRLAKKLKVKRAELIARGLQAILNEEIPAQV